MCFFSVALIMFVRSTSVCKGPSTGEQKVQKDFYLAIFTLHASFWINRSNNRLILLSPPRAPPRPADLVQVIECATYM